MIVVIDYGMGNLGSIANMLRKIGADAIVTSRIADIEQADKLILPGVGAFDNGMRNLNDRGLIPILETKVLEDKTPILGLCLGMQLFTMQSEEGKMPGLDWIRARTVRFRFQSDQMNLKVPHMGWNFVKVMRPNRIWDDLGQKPRFYFVHSYHAICESDDNVLGTTVYGYEFPSVIGKDNIIGTQFHPEKSHKFGMKLLRNFVGC